MASGLIKKLIIHNIPAHDSIYNPYKPSKYAYKISDIR